MIRFDCEGMIDGSFERATARRDHGERGETDDDDRDDARRGTTRDDAREGDA
jgi:hypothetical protein